MHCGFQGSEETAARPEEMSARHRGISGHDVWVDIRWIEESEFKSEFDGPRASWSRHDTSVLGLFISGLSKPTTKISSGTSEPKLGVFFQFGIKEWIAMTERLPPDSEGLTRL